MKIWWLRKPGRGQRERTPQSCLLGSDPFPTKTHTHNHKKIKISGQFFNCSLCKVYCGTDVSEVIFDQNLWTGKLTSHKGPEVLGYLDVHIGYEWEGREWREKRNDNGCEDRWWRQSRASLEPWTSTTHVSWNDAFPKGNLTYAASLACPKHTLKAEVVHRIEIGHGYQLARLPLPLGLLKPCSLSPSLPIPLCVLCGFAKVCVGMVAAEPLIFILKHQPFTWSITMILLPQSPSDSVTGMYYHTWFII